MRQAGTSLEFRVIVYKAAQRDSREVQAYLLGESPKTVERFAAAVATALRTVGESPLRWPLVEPDIRRYLLPDLPYQIFYRISGKTAFILRIVHQRRHPDIWRTPP